MDKSLNHETYTRLKREIMTFTLKPGDSVSAAKLAERYQVSRTPVREALVKLETEDLVHIYPQSKTIISKINIHRVKQEWFLRKTLELGMVDVFFKKIQNQDIDLMQMYNKEIGRITMESIGSDDDYDFHCYDNDFHGVAYMAAGEKLSATVIYYMTAHYNRLRVLIDSERTSKQRILAEHEYLVECIQNRDKKKYRDMLDMHLSHILNDIDDMRERYPNYFEE